MVKKKSNQPKMKAGSRRGGRRRLGVQKSGAVQLTKLSKMDLDEVDLLSEALSRTLKADDQPRGVDEMPSKKRGVKKRHTKAKRAAKRKAVKVKSASAARKVRRRT